MQQVSGSSTVLVLLVAGRANDKGSALHSANNREGSICRFADNVAIVDVAVTRDVSRWKEILVICYLGTPAFFTFIY